MKSSRASARRQREIERGADVHFGLGPATTVRRLTVRWPDGKVTTLKGVAAGRVVTVRER